MPRIKPGGRMGITQRREGWEDLFATRTRGDVGEGLGSILALSTATDLISFSGGFPDPATFPGPVLAEILRRLIAAGDASAMQYAPTPGLPGPRGGPHLPGSHHGLPEFPGQRRVRAHR